MDGNETNGYYHYHKQTCIFWPESKELQVSPVIPPSLFLLHKPLPLLALLLSIGQGRLKCLHYKGEHDMYTSKRLSPQKNKKMQGVAGLPRLQKRAKMGNDWISCSLGANGTL